MDSFMCTRTDAKSRRTTANFPMDSDQLPYGQWHRLPTNIGHDAEKGRDAAVFDPDTR
jgi:hypothetical protein